MNTNYNSPSLSVFARKYLLRYGYLNDSKSTSRASEEEISYAIALFQDIFGLEKTGVLNKQTFDAMKIERCGMPDIIDNRFSKITCAWDRKSLNYSLGDATQYVSADQAFQAVRNAFATWSSITSFSFHEVSSDQFPDIIIGWVTSSDSDFPNMAQNDVLAHADYPPNCAVISGIGPRPLHFNDTTAIWCVGATPGAFDIESVALHEIGHILGLAHSSDISAVMYPSVQPNAIRRDLAQDDIDGIRQLYP
ncbi:matrixin family metalloprotease [Prosthecobacter sp.]|uniref:matrixin family metalloprotease n=1 Tax=Prosthecobacter sp. TaxID=1965333 RepID=UPI0037842A9B